MIRIVIIVGIEHVPQRSCFHFLIFDLSMACGHKDFLDCVINDTID